jgi:class 3 adenylate cyclase/predicted ATPase
VSSRPRGLVTLLFTDLVGSTELWNRNPDQMRENRRLHLEMADRLIEQHRGFLFKTVGDAVCAAFESPHDAVECARLLQIQTRNYDWGKLPLMFRAGIHTGEIDEEGGDYVGPAANRVARICGLAHAHQIAASESTFALLKSAYEWQAWGEVTLRGFAEPEAVVYLVDPQLPQNFPPLAPVQTPNNLTQSDRAFVGRQKELSDLRRKVLQGERLITISGMGGMGKTTLAREFAWQRLEEFPGGVWFIETENLSGPDAILAAFADRFSTEAPSVEALAESLPTEPVLVVFDCLESHLDAAPMLDDLVRHTKNLQVLVTSRVVLGLAREFEYALEPMGTANRGADAVQLFLEAAEHAVDDFHVTSKERSLVRQLCEQLEGVPLAIVLAASRLRVMTLPELSAMVQSRRHEVIARARPTSRHDTLMGVVASSFQLLDPADQKLLVRLAAFRGGFWMHDAMAILDDPLVIDGLTRLREASLLMAAPDRQRTRFRLLDTVREYLVYVPREEGLANVLERDAGAHAEHFSGVAQAIRGEEVQGNWSRAVHDFWLELPNFRSAIAYADLRDRSDLLARFARALCHLFTTTGLWDDFDHLANRAMIAAEAGGDLELQAQILLDQGVKLRRQGLEGEARPLLERRIRICEARGDHAEAIDGYSDLALQSLETGDAELAREPIARGLRLIRKHRNFDLLALLRVCRLRLAHQSGDAARVSRLIDLVHDSIPWMRSDMRKLSVLGHLAEVLSSNEQFGPAQIAYEEAVQIAVAADRPYSAVRLIIGLSGDKTKQGALTSAAHLLAIASAAPIDKHSNQAGRLQAAIASFPEPRLIAEAETTNTAIVWPPDLPLSVFL